MKRLFLTLFCALAMFGQETVSRVLQLKNIQAEGTNAVLDILSAGKVRWRTDGNRIIALNGPAELVEAMEAAVIKLDVPKPAGDAMPARLLVHRTGIDKAHTGADRKNLHRRRTIRARGRSVSRRNLINGSVADR